MATTWEHTDADFTFQQLADTIAWLLETHATFDPTETEDLNNRLTLLNTQTTEKGNE